MPRLLRADATLRPEASGALADNAVAAGPAALLARRERGRARDLGSSPKTSSTKGPFPSCAPRRRALCGVAGSGPSRTRRSPTNSAGVFFAARGAAPPHDRSEPCFYDGCLDTAWHALPQKLCARLDSAYAYRRGRLSVGVASACGPSLFLTAICL